MSEALTSEESVLLNFSNECAQKVIEQAFEEMKRDFIISLWCGDITNTAVHLADTYQRFTKSLCGSVLCEAAEKYSEHYALVHHLIPWADRFSQNIIESASAIHNQCDAMCCQIFKLAVAELKKLEKFKKVGIWASDVASAVLHYGISVYLETQECERSNVGASTRTEFSKTCEEPGDPDPCQSYAQSLVHDLFSMLGVHEYTTITISQSSQSDKSKSSHCGSCESISSDLLSPHSTADSRGLHHFADKLLYSLSTLENRSTESISSTETTDMRFSIVDCYRRSSAPELRVSSRKSSLKTVIEEMPMECPSSARRSHKFKQYPSTSLGRRLRSSEERRCASMESIDDAPNRSSYSEILAKNILFSVYNDMV